MFGDALYPTLQTRCELGPGALLGILYGLYGLMLGSRQA